MTNETQTTDIPDEDAQFAAEPAPLVQDELATLKARAEQLGMSFHPSIGVTSLKAKIEAFLEGTKTTQDTSSEDTDEEVQDPEVPETVTATKNEADDSVTYAPKETEIQKRIRLRKHAAKLVRVKITCMNPNKKDWPGEIITVGNSHVGTHKKFIPFNTGDEGYHIPNIIYEYLKTRECPTYRTGAKGFGDVQKRELVMIREFAIEVLPDLDQEALNDLAQRQAMSGGTSGAVE